MAQEQAQSLCRQCNCLTLHQRITQGCPHVVHLLLMLLLFVAGLFTCGIGFWLGLLWIPIWVFHALLVDVANGRHPFRCSRCGQATDEPTAAERMAEEQALAVATANSAAIREQKRRARQQWIEEEMAKFSAWLRTIPPFLTALPGRFDRLLATIAGPRNEILHYFLRCLSVAVIAAAIVVFIAIAPQLMSKVASRVAAFRKAAPVEVKANTQQLSPIAAKPAPPPQPPKPDWIDASEPFNAGPVSVRVAEVTVGKVPVSGIFAAADGMSASRVLCIWLETSSIPKERRKLDYHGCKSSSVKDNHGNEYRSVDAAGWGSIVGSTTSKILYPGDSAKEALTFEVPVEGVEYLSLIVLVSCDGMDKRTIKFRIPSAMVDRH